MSIVPPLTAPVPTALARVVRNPHCDLRPDGAGRLMLHRNDTDATLAADLAPSPGMTEAQVLVARAARLLPSIAGARPEAARIAVRPIPKDGRSAVGPVPGLDAYYLIVTHSGVTLGPFLARLVADEILRGRAAPELESFRPSRFFAGNLGPAGE